jgi:hypothetical protein
VLPWCAPCLRPSNPSPSSPSPSNQIKPLHYPCQATHLHVYVQLLGCPCCAPCPSPCSLPSNLSPTSPTVPGPGPSASKTSIALVKQRTFMCVKVAWLPCCTRPTLAPQTPDPQAPAPQTLYRPSHLHVCVQLLGCPAALLLCLILYACPGCDAQ